MEACAQGMPVNWRQAKVRFPSHLDAVVGQPSIYEATVDIRGVRPPDDQVIAVGPDTATKQVMVQCRLAARLIPSSDVLDIDPDSSDWVFQDFTPIGVVQWGWTVTPTKPTNQKLTLSLRPAIDIFSPDGSSSRRYPEDLNTVRTLPTDVTVNGTFVEEASYWFETQWPLLTGILGVLALALGVAATKGRSAWRWLREGRASKSATSSPEPEVGQANAEQQDDNQSNQEAR